MSLIERPNRRANAVALVVALSGASLAGTALAGPDLVSVVREVRVGASGPGASGFSELEMSASAGMFQDTVADGGIINGVNISASAGQTSDLVTLTDALNFSGSGSSGLAAIASGAGEIGALSASRFDVEFTLAQPGSVDLLWSLGATGTGLNSATQGVATIRLTNETTGVNVFEQSREMGVDSGFFEADLAAGSYRLLALATSTAFQGTVGGDFLPLGGNVTLGSSWGLTATIVPAPAPTALVAIGGVLASRRRR